MNKHPDDMQAASKPGHARDRIPTEPRKTIVAVPSPPSETLKGVRFTERHQAYRGGDTWYPCWADDGNLSSPWTDGGLAGMVSGSSHGEQAKTGHAVMIGDDPMNLELRNTSPPKVASALPYQGRCPGGSLMHNGIWYYGTCCLEADKITGPWHMVTYMKDIGEQGFFLNFPSKFISADGRTLWLCCSANFSPGYNGDKIMLNPPGGRGTLRLQEMELITANPGTER